MADTALLNPVEDLLVAGKLLRRVEETKSEAERRLLTTVFDTHDDYLRAAVRYQTLVQMAASLNDDYNREARNK